MRQLTGRPTMRIVLLLLFAGVVAARPVDASNDVLTLAKGKLDAERFAKFQSLYAESEQAEKDERLAVDAAEKADPLFRDAKRGVVGDGSQEKAKTALETAEDEIAKQSPGSMPDYRRWRQLCRKSLSAERVKTSAADPAQRAWILWAGRKTIKWLASAPDGVIEPSVKEAQPKPGMKLTDDEVVATLEKMARLPDKERVELQQLEQKLQQVRLPRKELDAYDVANGRRHAYTMYLQENTPSSVRNAEANSLRISNEMTAIWPEWGQASPQAH